MSVINPRCAKQWSGWIWTGKHKAIRKHTRKPYFILSCTLTILGQVSCYSANCLTQNVINLWNYNHWTNHFCHNFLCQCISLWDKKKAITWMNATSKLKKSNYGLCVRTDGHSSEEDYSNRNTMCDDGQHLICHRRLNRLKVNSIRQE